MAPRPSDRERQRASDPSTPASELLTLAARCPDEVLANPALDLLSLADPLAWGGVVARARAERDERQLRSALLSAPAAALRRFSVVTLLECISIWKQLKPACAADADALALALSARGEHGAPSAEHPSGKALSGRIGDRGKRQGDAVSSQLGHAAYVVFEKATRERLEGAARSSAEVAVFIAEQRAEGAPAKARARAEARAEQLARLAEIVATTPGRLDLEVAVGGQLSLRFGR